MSVIDEIRRNLKPCPLCGSCAELKISDQGRDTSMWHTIRCTKCGCNISHNDSGYNPDYEKDLLIFFRKWNARKQVVPETYEGYNLDQLQEMAAVLRACNMSPQDLANTWTNFAAVVASVQAATERAWREKLQNLIGKMEDAAHGKA